MAINCRMSMAVRTAEEPRVRAANSGTLLLLALCLAASLPAQAQTPVVTTLANAATGRSSSSTAVAARGSIVSIFGTNLSGSTASSSGFPLPTQLGGTQVLFGGVAAPLLYVSATQVNAQVPFELADVTSLNLVVQNGGNASAPLQVTLLAQDPGVFDVLKSGMPVGPGNPVFAGDTLTIYATGLGAVLPALPSGQPGPSGTLAMAAIAPVVSIGGLTATVTFAGVAPGQVVYQINATAPASLVGSTTNVTVTPGVIPAVTGPPGPTGPAGAAGTTGSSGTTGATGPAGVTGATGPAGVTGANGLAGQAGDAGPPGGQGPGGPQGPVGATGVTGLTWKGAWSAGASYNANDGVGFNGSSYIALLGNNTGNTPGDSPSFWSLLAQVGSTGPTGVTGAVGVTGSTGTMGVTGSTGATGAVGTTGGTGPIGVTGVTGSVGATGSTGTPGATGPSGSTGATGNVGPTGAVGATGNLGSTGPTGTPGATGSAGATGGVGPTGAVGATGNVGAIGPTGTPGATGSAGATGSLGPTGAAGPTGNVGATGPTGTPGATGSIGNTGATGNAGPTGPTGTAGATGSVGNTGANGATGPAGPTGANGTNGTNGSNGATGATGPTGSGGTGVLILGNFVYQGGGNPTTTYFPVNSVSDPTVDGVITDFSILANVMPAACTIDTVRVFQPSISGGTGTLTVQLFRSVAGTGTPTATSISLSVTNGGNVQSTGNSLAVAAGDTLAFKLSGGNVGNSTNNIVLLTGIHCQ
jgi:uncharacterized protein (TIGR03437 family)